MKTPRRRFVNHAGLTWVECLVLLAILAVLFLLPMHPPMEQSLTKGQMAQMLSNMKQLHLATQQVALDGTTTGNTNLRWPGDRDGTFSNWVASVAPDYLTPGDLRRLLSAPERKVKARDQLASNSTAVLVYAVKEESEGNVVFLSSANFTNTPAGGDPLKPDALPFGNKGFVVFRKAGDGAILMPKQVGQTNVIGAFAPLCR